VPNKLLFGHVVSSLLSDFLVAKIMLSKGSHREVFEKFCSKYLDLGKKNTSKTILDKKAKRIKGVLNGVQVDASNSFKFWINKTKQFTLLNYPELQLNNVLCLPAKHKLLIIMHHLACLY